MIDKIFRKRHIEIIFPENWLFPFSICNVIVFQRQPFIALLTFHANCLLKRHFFMKYQILFSGKNKNIDLSSAELAQRVIKVKVFNLWLFFQHDNRSREEMTYWERRQYFLATGRSPRSRIPARGRGLSSGGGTRPLRGGRGLSSRGKSNH